MSAIRLSSGFTMPCIGLGTFLSKPGEVKNAVLHALNTGYTHIDCAHVYGNECEVGQGIKESCKNRENLFITSKLWNNSHKPDRVLPALKKSLSDLQLEYLDLYLIHWPIALKEGDELMPQDENGNCIFDNSADFIYTWKAMEKCVEQGLIKSIGVSNFSIDQLKRILEIATIKPAVNQVECHPFLQQNDLIKFCGENNIAITAYSPLGAPGRPWASSDEPIVMEQEIIKKIADNHNKLPAQVCIRFQIQRGNIVIPKSVTNHRIESNFNIFDFELSQEEMNEIKALNKDYRYFVLSKYKESKFYPF